MRVVHVTDAHCMTSAVSAILAREPHDLAVSSGDFECLDTVEAFLEGSAKALSTTGNMDNPSVYRRLDEAGALIDGRIVSFRGLTIGGVGGLDVHGSMEQFRRTHGAGIEIDVLVSHHPPHGVLDAPLPGVHAGLFEVKRLVDEYRPVIHLFGHIHESRGSERVAGTLFVNSGPALSGYYSVIELGSGKPRVLLKRLQ